MRVGAGLDLFEESSATSHPRSGGDARTIVDGLVRFGDMAAVAGSGLLASRLRFANVDHPDIAAAAPLMGILFASAVFSLLRLYDVERLVRLDVQLSRLLAGWTITVGAVLTVLYGMKSATDLSRLWVGYWFLAGGVSLTAWRFFVRHALQKAPLGDRLRRKLVLIGHGEVMAGCLARLKADHRGVKIAAALALDGEFSALPEGCRRIQDWAALDAAVCETGADQVILTVPLSRTSEIWDLLCRLKHLSVEVSLYPDIVGIALPSFGVTRLVDMPLIQLMRHPLEGWPYFLKNWEDRLGAAALLVLTAPILGLAAVGIKLTSPGPVFYRQLRRGFNRAPIFVFKLRTMYTEHCDAPDAAQVRQVTRDDPRVTPIGRILRRFSVDELPQLLNVLRGEMSLIGPRPHAMAHDEHYSRLIDGYLTRHRVKPGITGWAQINGCRGETHTLEQMRRRIELDLEYIENWSLLLDLRILVHTLFFGLSDRNAY